jgi:patatin-like phospholipase/acyl hydrolase
MRGLYTAALLNTLSSRFGNNLDVGKGFDLIVGTSTGGLVAAGLASGIPLAKIMYLKK